MFKLDKCENCGKELTFPFSKCSYCAGIFCDDCRLPPRHDCIFINEWRKKSKPITKKLGKKPKNTPKKIEKPQEVIEEEEQLSEEEREAYLFLRNHFCYGCGKPLYDSAIGVCSACNLSFCSEHLHDHGCLGYDKIKVLPLGIKYEDIYWVCFCCGEIGDTYICKYCGGQFCNEHKYPDEHRCKFTPPKYMRIEDGVITYIPRRYYKD